MALTKLEMVEEILRLKADIIALAEELEPDGEDSFRLCSACGKVMTEGYCIEGGEAYYCCNKCLLTKMSFKDYLKLYAKGEGESYWTSWAEDYLTQSELSSDPCLK